MKFPVLGTQREHQVSPQRFRQPGDGQDSTQNLCWAETSEGEASQASSQSQADHQAQCSCALREGTGAPAPLPTLLLRGDGRKRPKAPGAACLLLAPELPQRCRHQGAASPPRLAHLHASAAAQYWDWMAMSSSTMRTERSTGLGPAGGRTGWLGTAKGWQLGFSEQEGLQGMPGTETTSSERGQVAAGLG